MSSITMSTGTTNTMPTGTTNSETTVFTNPETTVFTNQDTTRTSITEEGFTEEACTEQVPPIYDFYQQVLSGETPRSWIVYCMVINPDMEGCSDHKTIFSLIVEALNYEEAIEKAAQLFSEDENFCCTLRGCKVWYSKLPDKLQYDLPDSAAVYELLMNTRNPANLELSVMPLVAPGRVQCFNDWNQLRHQFRDSSNSYYGNYSHVIVHD